MPNTIRTRKRKKSVHKIAGEIEKNYNMKNPFSFVFMNKNENIDSEFLWEVAKDGIVLYATPELILGQKQILKPAAFISYTFADIPPKDKMFIKRKLYGYQVKSVHKGKKILKRRKRDSTRTWQKDGKSNLPHR